MPALDRAFRRLAITDGNERTNVLFDAIFAGVHREHVRPPRMPWDHWDRGELNIGVVREPIGPTNDLQILTEQWVPVTRSET